MKSTNKSAYIVLILLLLTLTSSSSFGQRRKLSPELQEKRGNLGAMFRPQAPEELIDVIVQARPGSSLDKHRQKMASLPPAHRTTPTITTGSVSPFPPTTL